MDENEQGNETVMEKLQEFRQNSSVGESLEEVNSILIGIDKELGLKELNLDKKESLSSSSDESIEVQDSKETDLDSLKDEKSKKTISFR